MRADSTAWMVWSFCAATCGALLGVPGQAQAAWETRDLGGTTTHVYTPSSQSPIGEGRGLMVVLHGCSQTATTLRDNGNFEPAAEAYGMVVAVPAVPGGGVLAGCWNYYGGTVNADTNAVIAVAEELLVDAGLGIDGAQVYAAGFSSGGGEAQVVACAAPELFAGVAVIAGPSLGTEAIDVFAVPAGLDAATLAGLCNDLAGPAALELATHLAITMSDTSDFSVAQGYATLDAEMFATLYEEQGAALSASTDDLADEVGSMPSGTEYIQSDAEGPRISRLQTSGLGHNWPAGSGLDPGAFTFVTGEGIDFATYAAKFFTNNNRRVPVDEGTGTGDSGSGGDGSGDTTAGPGLDDSGTGGVGSTSGVGNPGGTSGTGSPTETDGGSTGDPGATGDADPAPSGCQCTTVGSRPGTPQAGWLGMGLYLGLGLAAARRRRRAAPVPAGRRGTNRAPGEADHPDSLPRRA